MKLLRRNISLPALTFVVIAALLLIWKALLWFDLPQAGADAVGYLSQTFSLMRGEWLRSTFTFAPLVPFPLPYGYSVLTLPFFALLPKNEHAIFLWNLLLLVGISIQVGRLLTQGEHVNLWSKLIIFVSFIVSPYLYGPRPETLNVVFCVIILGLLSSWKQNISLPRLAIIAILTAISGLVQPVGGWFCVFFVCALMLQNHCPTKSYVAYFAILLGVLAISYGPIVLMDAKYWAYNFFARFAEGDARDKIDPLLFAKYAVYNVPIFVVYFVMLLNIKNFKKIFQELLILAIFVAILSPFNRSYYFPYIQVLVLWRILCIDNARVPGWIGIFVLLIVPFFTHYWPTFQQIENRAYAAEFRKIIETTYTYRDVAVNHKLWVPAPIAMPVISQPGTRQHFSFRQRFFGEGISLVQGDVILCTSQQELDYIMRQLQVPKESLSTKELIAPVRGLLTLTPFMDRSAPIGLWEISYSD